MPQPNPSDTLCMTWYFDFISPFAYFQHRALLAKLKNQQVTLNYRPVLLAGLLKHWQQLGPAEIPAKRTMTYQYCHWYAQQHDIPFKVPPAHPFNPLSVLRLAIASHCSPDAITAIFDAIWGQGLDLSNPIHWQDLITQNQLTNPQAHLGEQWVKDTLRSNTEHAAEKGVFGVPTLAVHNKLFWGYDMTQMAFDYLNTPDLFNDPEYQRMEQLPIGQARKTA